jgi:hypothetical protein
VIRILVNVNLAIIAGRERLSQGLARRQRSVTIVGAEMENDRTVNGPRLLQMLLQFHSVVAHGRVNLQPCRRQFVACTPS